MNAAELRRASWPWALMALALGVAAVVAGGHDREWSQALRVAADASGEHWRQVVAIIKPFGRGEVLIVLALMIIALGQRAVGLRVLLAGAALIPVVPLLKAVVGRERPNGGNDSFASGDTATAWAIAIPLVMSLGWRWMWMVAVAAGVAMGRVVEGWHWPSDVLAGAAIGICAGIAGCAMESAWPIAKRWRFPWWMSAIAAAVVVMGWSIVATIDGGAVMSQVVAATAMVIVPVLALLLVARWWRVACTRIRWSPGLVLGVLSALMLIGYAGLATATTLWDRDEPRNATAALEMIANGQWMVPTLNGEWRLHKPILPYWLMMLSASIFGHNDWAVRLPAVLSSLGIGLATAFIGWRLWSPRAGVLAALVVWTCPLMLIAGTAATTDAVMLLGVVSAIAGAVAVWTTPRALGESMRPRWAMSVFIGIAIGWAQLGKGPIGLAVPMLAMLGVAALRWRDGLLSLRWQLHLLVMLLLSLGCFVAWAAPANAFTDGKLLEVGLGKHVIQRSRESMEGHKGPFYFYLLVLVVTMMPWTMLLPATLRRLWIDKLGSPLGSALIWVWLLPTLLIFSLMQTKLPHYILPMVPALALTIAAAWCRGLHDRWDRILLGAGGWLVAVGALGFAVALVVLAVMPWFQFTTHRPFPGLIVPLAGLAFVVVACVWCCVRAVKPSNGDVAFIGSMALSVIAITMTIGFAAGPRIEALILTPRIAERIRSNTPPSVPVATMFNDNGYAEPSLYFAVDRFPIRQLSDYAELQTWIDNGQPGVVVLTSEQIQRATAALAMTPSATRPLSCVPLGDPITGFNYSRGKWLDVMVLVKPQH